MPKEWSVPFKYDFIRSKNISKTEELSYPYHQQSDRNENKMVDVVYPKAFKILIISYPLSFSMNTEERLRILKIFSKA